MGIERVSKSYLYIKKYKDEKFNKNKKHEFNK